MLRILDRFIIKKYLGTFFFTIGIFVLIIIIFDLSEKLDDFIKSGLSLWGIFAFYYAGSVPYYVNMLYPLINFIAVIFFTAKMANQTEIVPILSGGVSFNRFLRPYFIAASILFIISLTMNLYIMPITNRLMNSFVNTYVKRNDSAVRNNIHIKLDNNTYVYMQSFDNKTNTGEKFTLDNFNGDELVRKLAADQILWDAKKKKWKLVNYSVRHIKGLNETLTTATAAKDTVLDMSPNDFSAYENIYQNLSTRELNEKIDKEQIRGSGDLNDLLFEKYQRWLQPFSAYILTLIGVALSSRKVRGGVGLPLGIGIVLSFFYIVLNRFAMVFTIKGGFPPFISVVTPTIIFLVLGIYLIVKAPK